MAAVFGWNRRYAIVSFLVLFVLFIGMLHQKPDVRKLVPFGTFHYSEQASISDNSNSKKSDNSEFIEKIEKGEIEQDDPELISYIRTMIFQPSLEPYNIQTTDKDTSMGQAAVVNKVLNEMKNGFFVECGALDGETRSNTYYFERYLGWEGILIEGDPSNFKLLLEKRRKSYSINVCLSTQDKPMKVVFQQSFNVGKIVPGVDMSKLRAGYIPVQCFPLYSILLALNRTTVDYFSLDVEGAELDVLKTVPFDKVNIRVLSVEYIHDKDGESGVKDFMESKGYIAHQKVNNPQNLANDIIFVKQGLLP